MNWHNPITLNEVEDELKKVINNLTELLHSTESTEAADDIKRVCDMYRIALRAVRKSESHAVVIDGEWARCPSCGCDDYLMNHDDEDNEYCGFCGQRLCWPSETDEED